MPARILVVDDEPLILTAVERSLAKVGYSIYCAQNMRELEERLAEAPFDLLITDVHMEGDSVDNIIRKVRRTSPRVKVLKMSGAASTDRQSHFIEKPFSIETLRNRVREILDEPS